MELTATNRPRAWPGSLGRQESGRMEDVYVVLKAYGTGKEVRKEARKGLGRTGFDNAGFLKYGQNRQIMKI